MTRRRGARWLNWWSLLPLRLRLTLYFVMVSVPPVLVASFIAAEVISLTFERNVERWIGEIATFMANEAAEGREEAQRATAVVAAAVARGGTEPIEPFADLLTTVGYDFVRLYTGDGKVLFSTGDLELMEPLPLKAVSSIFFVRQGGHRAMMVGAVQPVRIGDQAGFLFIANLLDEKFFTAPQTIRSLDLHLIEVTKDGDLRDLEDLHRTPLPVPPEMLAALRAGAPLVIQRRSFGIGPAAAFAALRDDGGRLVGIIACRLNGTPATFERLGTVSLFGALAAVSGILSLLVGFSFSRRMSRPLHDLTRGVRAVAEGNYAIRVRETGGREIEALASGFNAMTEQLQTLRDRETATRHRAQLATLGQAAAVIAHEIRNPLGIIKTSAELVRRKTSMAPSEDRLMMFVLDEVQRIDRLVKELLDYARPPQCTLVPLDLVASIVRPALDFVAPELRRRNISLIARLPDHPLPIQGDKDLLHQALLNLIINAMDAAGDGGHVIVRAELEADAAVLHVEDNGPGIPEDVRATLFEPFVTTKVNGTGLGLATVRSTVEVHGGEVACADALERGAIFTIRLPLGKQG